MTNLPLVAKLAHAALGAQLLGVQLGGGHQLLYRSPYAAEPGKPVRGGVPVLFPQFAHLGPLTKHGFARNWCWQLVCEKVGRDASSLTYQLIIGADMEFGWPYEADLKLQVDVTACDILMSLTVENTGKQLFSWTGGLHPYWWVPQLTDAKVTGLQETQVSDPLAFDGSLIERLYPAGNAVVLHAGGFSLELQTVGFDELVVWNPGREGARQIDDLPDEDWQHFVCIEPARISHPVVLGPGQTFTGQLKARLIVTKE